MRYILQKRAWISFHIFLGMVRTHICPGRSMFRKDLRRQKAVISG